MILVTLGTQDKSFHRLLIEIDKLIEKKVITDNVVVQAGTTTYKSNNMEILDFIDNDKLNELVKECSLLITHGGVGSIMSGIKNNKVVIAVPRLKEYKEHTNDHQLQIINNFSNNNYIIGINDVNELESALKKVKKFKPNKLISDNSKIINLLDDYIKEYI